MARVKGGLTEDKLTRNVQFQALEQGTETA